MHQAVKVLLGFGLWFLFSGCEKPPDPDLAQANRAVGKMAANISMTRSCFSLAYPNGKASDFVDYLFSDLGTLEWPVAMDEMEEKQMRSAGQTPLPSDVMVSRLQRRHQDQKEIVLQGDDTNRTLLVEGYLPGEDRVNLKAEWPVGTAQADEFATSLCNSNIEMGMGITPNF
jgi:hypothetical protein